jgi:hypothetical protein
MITLVRTARAVTGKVGEAVKVSSEFIPLMQKVSGKPVKAAVGFGGDVAMIAAFIEFDDANAVEKFYADLAAMPEYHALSGKLIGLVMPEYTRDQLWRHLS